MKVSGFTFIRNGVQLGYPFKESILSVLPICDEFIVAVGRSDDETLEEIKSIDSDKIKIIETEWNESMHERGYVYGQQKMIAQFNCNGDWAFYLEGDEIVHEDDYDNILKSMERHLDDSEVESLAFDYHHFYGSPSNTIASPGWYRREVRIIRNTIRTIAPDGLYFVVLDPKKRGKKGRYPKAALANAHIYHYGHVRSVEKMRNKMESVGKYWGHKHDFEGYDNFDAKGLAPFNGTHPKAIQQWLSDDAEKNFKIATDHKLTKKELRYRWMMKLEKIFGLELSKKHFRLVKP